MDIENLIQKHSQKYCKKNYGHTKKLDNLEDDLIKALGEAELMEIYSPFERLRIDEELENFEKAYEDGFRNGMQLMKSILKLLEVEDSELKEVTIGERAS